MYGWSFTYEFQYLVSRGFALIYSNPRGSDGYSEEFADIRKHYGERDYMDLMEVVDETLKIYSDIDPERLGVTGGSYGGYMTNWIITQTDKFKAAVTQRSISDWISMFGTTDIGHYFVPDQIGCIPWENPDRCLEKSPLRYANRVKTPTLIIHSLEDYRCWVDQAIAFFRALKLNGVKTKLVLFPKENHELSRSGKPKHRVENIRHISGWFEEHLKR
jgi:acylaminoacyl-peptidase